MKALESASSNEKHSLLAVPILEEAYKQKDPSPMGCTFDCQLVDHFMEHSDRHSKTGTSVQTSKEFKNFAESSFARYCRVTSGKRENVSAIPDYLVLSSAQEKKLKRLWSISPVFEPFSPFNKMTACKKEEQLPVNKHDIAWGATRVAQLPYASLERLSTEMQKEEWRKKTVLLDLYTIFRSKIRGAEAFCKKILEKVPNEQLFIIKDLQPHIPLAPPRLKAGKGEEISIDENVNALVSLDVLATLLSSHFNPPQIEKKELGPFPLKSSEDPMEQSMIHALKQGHNQLGKKTTYTLKTDRSDLKKGLETCFQKLSARSLELEKDLQKRLETISASFLIHEATYLNVAWKSGMISKPTLADLVVLVLSRNSSQLLKKNPSLSKREIKNLTHDFFTYLACASECAQIKEALSQLDSQDSFAIQKVGMLLDQKRSYKLHEYPEFLIYEWGTSKILREDQVKNLHAIYLAALKEGKSDLLLEFAAGGGKTKVMIPILAQMLARLGYLPVINTTSFLYASNKEDITESLHSAFKQMCELIEINIDNPLPLEKLQSIQRALPLWKEEKKALYIQAESWDALFIARLVALSKNDRSAYEALDAIITFFETHGFRIVDESHQTDSPFTETLRSFGNSKTIPHQQQKLLFKTYLYLDQLTPRLKEGTLSQTEESEQKELLKKLKEKLLNDPLLKNVEKEQLSLYLENPSKKRPEWLKNAPRDISNLVILTKALFTTFLPHIFLLRTHLDFGASIREGDLTVAPRQAKQPLRSHFAVHTLTTALTIQEVFRKGINPQQMKMIFSDLIQKILKSNKTELLIHLFGEKVDVLQINLDNEKHLIEMAKHYGRRENLLEFYLMQYALPQIKVQSSRLTVSPSIRSQGFKKNLYVSATCGIREIYPVGLKEEDCQRDPSFAAEVVETLCLNKNTETLFLSLDSNDLKPFVEKVFNKTHACVFLDRGGILRDVSSSDFVTTLLEVSKNHYTGSLYFDQEKLNYKRKKDGKIIQLKGTELVSALRKEKIEFMREQIFTLVNIDKTTGLDLKQPNQGVGILTVGEDQTLTETIQAAMRLRLFLWENGQTLCWIIPPQVEKGIVKAGKESTVPERLQAMLKTEARKFKKALLIRAKQGIKALIGAIVWRDIQNQKGFKEKVELYQLRKAGFEEKIPFDPFDLYELETTPEPTAMGLRAFAVNYYHTFGYQDDPFFALKEEAEWEKLETLIMETATFIDVIEMGSISALDQKMTQHQEQTTEMNQDMKQDQIVAQISTYVSPEKTFITFKDFAADFIGLTERLKLTDPPRLPPLLFKKDYFDIAEFEGLKPIRGIIIEYTQEKEFVFYVASAIQLETQLQAANNTNSKPSIIAYDEKGRCLRSFIRDKKILNELETSQEFRDILLFVALLRGEAESEMVEMLKRYGWSRNHFQEFWVWLQNMHVSRTPLDAEGFKEIKRSL